MTLTKTLADELLFTRVPNGRVLTLNLKKSWYDMMVTGEKDFEIRRPSAWILQRLTRSDGQYARHDRQFSGVRFLQGYDRFAPRFIAEYLGYKVTKESSEWEIPERFGGGVLEIPKGYYFIKLGKVFY